MLPLIIRFRVGGGGMAHKLLPWFIRLGVGQQRGLTMAHKPLPF